MNKSDDVISDTTRNAFERLNKRRKRHAVNDVTANKHTASTSEALTETNVSSRQRTKRLILIIVIIQYVISCLCYWLISFVTNSCFWRFTVAASTTNLLMSFVSIKLLDRWTLLFDISRAYLPGHVVFQTIRFDSMSGICRTSCCEEMIVGNDVAWMPSTRFDPWVVCECASLMHVKSPISYEFVMQPFERCVEGTQVTPIHDTVTMTDSVMAFIGEDFRRRRQSILVSCNCAIENSTAIIHTTHQC